MPKPFIRFIALLLVLSLSKDLAAALVADPATTAGLSRGTPRPSQSSVLRNQFWFEEQALISRLSQFFHSALNARPAIQTVQSLSPETPVWTPLDEPWRLPPTAAPNGPPPLLDAALERLARIVGSYPGGGRARNPALEVIRKLRSEYYLLSPDALEDTQKALFQEIGWVLNALQRKRQAKEQRTPDEILVPLLLKVLAQTVPLRGLLDPLNRRDSDVAPEHIAVGEVNGRPSVRYEGSDKRVYLSLSDYTNGGTNGYARLPPEDRRFARQLLFAGTLADRLKEGVKAKDVPKSVLEWGNALSLKDHELFSFYFALLWWVEERLGLVSHPQAPAAQPSRAISATEEDALWEIVATGLSLLCSGLGPKTTLYLSRHPLVGFHLEFEGNAQAPDKQQQSVIRTAIDSLNRLSERYGVPEDRTFVIDNGVAAVVPRSIAEGRWVHRWGADPRFVLEPDLSQAPAWLAEWRLDAGFDRDLRIRPLWSAAFHEALTRETEKLLEGVKRLFEARRPVTLQLPGWKDLMGEERAKDPEFAVKWVPLGELPALPGIMMGLLRWTPLGEWAPIAASFVMALLHGRQNPKQFAMRFAGSLLTNELSSVALRLASPPHSLGTLQMQEVMRNLNFDHLGYIALFVLALGIAYFVHRAWNTVMIRIGHPEWMLSTGIPPTEAEQMAERLRTIRSGLEEFRRVGTSAGRTDVFVDANKWVYSRLCTAVNAAELRLTLDEALRNANQARGQRSDPRVVRMWRDALVGLRELLDTAEASPQAVRRAIAALNVEALDSLEVVLRILDRDDNRFLRRLLGMRKPLATLEEQRAEGRRTDEYVTVRRLFGADPNSRGYLRVDKILGTSTMIRADDPVTVLKRLVKLAEIKLLKNRKVGLFQEFRLPLSEEDLLTEDRDLVWRGYTEKALPTADDFRSRPGAGKMLDFIWGSSLSDLPTAPDPAAQVVRELLLAYAALQAAYRDHERDPGRKRTLSAEELQAILKSHVPEPLLDNDPLIKRGLRWLELQGFAIRRMGHAYLVSGAAARRYVNVDIPHWPESAKKKWEELRREPESAGVIVERIRIIARVNGLAVSEMGRLAAHRLSNWEKAGDRIDVGMDTYDQLLEAWADDIGIEPILLRTGRSRAEQEERILAQILRIDDFGRRIALLRPLAGLSRRALARLVNGGDDLIHRLEAGGAPPLAEAFRYPLFADALGVDVFLIVMAADEAEALTRPMPENERLINIRFACGLSREQMAARLGISDTILKRWEVTEPEGPSPVEILAAARTPPDSKDAAEMRAMIRRRFDAFWDTTQEAPWAWERFLWQVFRNQTRFFPSGGPSQLSVRTYREIDAGLSKGALYGLLERLESGGYLERGGTRGHPPAIYYVVTEKARDWYAACPADFMPPSAQPVRSLLKRLPQAGVGKQPLYVSQIDLWSAQIDELEEIPPDHRPAALPTMVALQTVMENLAPEAIGAWRERVAALVGRVAALREATCLIPILAAERDLPSLEAVSGEEMLAGAGGKDYEAELLALDAPLSAAKPHVPPSLQERFSFVERRLAAVVKKLDLANADREAAFHATVNDMKQAPDRAAFEALDAKIRTFPARMQSRSEWTQARKATSERLEFEELETAEKARVEEIGHLKGKDLLRFLRETFELPLQAALVVGAARGRGDLTPDQLVTVATAVKQALKGETDILEIAKRVIAEYEARGRPGHNNPAMIHGRREARRFDRTLAELRSGRHTVTSREYQRLVERLVRIAWRLVPLAEMPFFRPILKKAAWGITQRLRNGGSIAQVMAAVREELVPSREKGRKVFSTAHPKVFAYRVWDEKASKEQYLEGWSWRRTTPQDRKELERLWDQWVEAALEAVEMALALNRSLGAKAILRIMEDTILAKHGEHNLHVLRRGGLLAMARPTRFAAGDVLIHPKHGELRVIEVKPYGDRDHLLVVAPGTEATEVGIRKFVESLLPIGTKMSRPGTIEQREKKAEEVPRQGNQTGVVSTPEPAQESKSVAARAAEAAAKPKESERRKAAPQARAQRRREEQVERRAALAAIVDELVSLGYSRLTARRQVASWPDPLSTWEETKRIRQELVHAERLSLRAATRLALDPQPSERLRAATESAQWLTGFWKNDEDSRAALILNSVDAVEARLQRARLPVRLIDWCLAPIIDWCLAPMRGVPSAASERPYWYMRLETVGELSAVLRSGALTDLPEDPLHPDLEKALILELGKRAQKHPSQLADHHYLETPLTSLKTPDPETGRLKSITLANLHRRYAVQKSDAQKGVSVAQVIFETHWPEEAEVFRQAAQEAAAWDQAARDAEWKADTLRHRRSIQKILRELYAAARKRFRERQANEKDERDRLAQLSKEERQRQKDADALEREINRWQWARAAYGRHRQRWLERELRLAEREMRREQRANQPPRKPATRGQARPWFEIISSPVAGLPPLGPRRGAIRKPSSEQVKRIRSASAVLSAAGASDETRIEAARTLHKLKNQLSFGELERIVYAVATSPLKEDPARPWLALAAQRRWDSITPALRGELCLRLERAVQSGTLKVEIAVGMQRPIFISLTADESRQSVPKEIETLWAGHDPAKKLEWIRLAVRSAQRRLQREWVPLSEFVTELGLPYNRFHRFVHNISLPLATCSMVGQLFSEPLLESALYTLRKDPEDVVVIDDLLGHIQKDQSALLAWAERKSGKAAPAYLAERFRLFFKGGTPSAEKDGVVPFVEKGLDRYLDERGISLTLDPKKEPSGEEKKVVGELLRRLAKTTGKKLENLGSEQFSKHVRLADREISLKPLYDRLQAVNETGYRTPYYILMRYGLAPRLSPVPEMRTLEDFRSALEVEHALDKDPYPLMHVELKRALVRDLRGETGKPFLWLERSDYINGALRRLQVGRRRFKMRNFYLHFNDANPDRVKKPTPFFILEELELVKEPITIRHPIQSLSSPREIRNALANGWIVNVAWRFLLWSLRALYVQEMASGLRRPLELLRAPDFWKFKRLANLTYRLKGRGKTRRLSLRGLYARAALEKPPALSTVRYVVKKTRQALKTLASGQSSVNPLRGHRRVTQRGGTSAELLWGVLVVAVAFATGYFTINPSVPRIFAGPHVPVIMLIAGASIGTTWLARPRHGYIMGSRLRGAA